MQKLCQFKDPQYGFLLNLLENYMPLVLSNYIISFKLNHFSEYFRAIIRIWIMFTFLQRRHYNKAPPVWINMCLHWGKYSQHLYQLLQNYIAVWWISSWKCTQYSASTNKALRHQWWIVQKSKAIFQCKKNCLTLDLSSHHQNSFVSSQLACIFKVKCAKVLTDMVKKNCTGPGRRFFFVRAEAR